MMIKYQRSIYIASIVIFVIFFSLSLLNMGKITTDESMYHFRNLTNFYENGFSAISNSKYSSANTPLPYMIVLVFAKIFSSTLFIARAVTALISIMALFIVIRLLEIHSSLKYVYLIFLFFPYFFQNSFIFYVINYGLLFSLLAFYFLLQIEGKFAYSYYFLVGLFSAFAVLCQQFYIVIIPCIFTAQILFCFKRKIALSHGQLAVSLLLLIIPSIIPLLVFNEWGGLTHPNFRAHSISFYPSTVVAILFVNGFYFFPYLLQSKDRLTKFQIFTSFFISLVLVLTFKPTFSDNQGPGIFTGIIHHLITLSGLVYFPLPVVLMVGLATCGILFFVTLYKDLSSSWELTLFFTTILLGIGYSCNTLIGERHLLGMITFLFLLVLPRIQKNAIGIFYVAFMACIGISYFFYVMFIKYSS